MLPGDKLLAVGTGGRSDSDIAMARYNADGSLDATFGGDGTITTDFGGAYGDFGGAAALLPDGKVLVAGARAVDDVGSPAPGTVGPALTESHNELFLGRFNPDGSLDRTFRDRGKVFVQRPDSWVEQVRSLVVLPDGSFVVSFGATLYRFSAGGARLGSVKTVDAGGISVGAALAVQPGGKILVAPFAGPNLARLNPDLSLDRTFGAGDGLTEMSYSPPRSIVVGPDGKILVTGQNFFPDVGTFAESTRYLPDGTYDLADRIKWGDTIDVPNDVAVSGEDRFFLALGTDAPNVDPPSRFAVAGYRGGRLDFDFGTQSVATFPYAPPTPPMGAADSANAAAMDSLGRVVVAGSVKGDFAVARFLV